MSFASQDAINYAKIKTMNFLLPTANKLYFNPSYLELSSHQQKCVSKCALMAVAEVIQEIEVLCRHRCKNQMQFKVERGSNGFFECPGYEGTLYFPTTLNKAISL